MLVGCCTLGGLHGARECFLECTSAHTHLRECGARQARSGRRADCAGEILVWNADKKSTPWWPVDCWHQQSTCMFVVCSANSPSLFSLLSSRCHVHATPPVDDGLLLPRAAGGDSLVTLLGTQKVKQRRPHAPSPPQRLALLHFSSLERPVDRPAELSVCHLDSPPPFFGHPRRCSVHLQQVRRWRERVVCVVAGHTIVVSR